MVSSWSRFHVDERGMKIPWTDRRTRTSFEFDVVDLSICRPRDGRSWTQASAADGGWSFPSTPLLSNPRANDQGRSMAGDMPLTIGASWLLRKFSQVHEVVKF
ncbi:hypothetical protein TIFTF001_045958 [Ficus carica]|uniref:Uncharacterized protein n=1 Tax=Ficus carica TaxID=3494 RepID=A0AA88D350_FICCA|nr:hypothetical protein TIFTF001_045958 [Ficus carica]